MIIIDMIGIILVVDDTQKPENVLRCLDKLFYNDFPNLKGECFCSTLVILRSRNSLYNFLSFNIGSSFSLFSEVSITILERGDWHR